MPPRATLSLTGHGSPATAPHSCLSAPDVSRNGRGCRATHQRMHQRHRRPDVERRGQMRRNANVRVNSPPDGSAARRTWSSFMERSGLQGRPSENAGLSRSVGGHRAGIARRYAAARHSRSSVAADRAVDRGRQRSLIGGVLVFGCPAAMPDSGHGWLGRLESAPFGKFGTAQSCRYPGRRGGG